MQKSHRALFAVKQPSSDTEQLAAVIDVPVMVQGRPEEGIRGLWHETTDVFIHHVGIEVEADGALHAGCMDPVAIQVEHERVEPPRA